MKLKAIPLLCAFLAVPVAAICATVLPDACGNEKVSFKIQLRKNAPAPAAPEAGKAQVFFIEKSAMPRVVIGCIGCSDVTRFGVDGAWVGATRSNSYFSLSLEPGVHHLCAVQGKEVEAEPLTVEAGQTYYFQVEYKTVQYGTPGEPGFHAEKKIKFSMLNEDDGKYRIKVSALSIATPKHP